MRIVITTTYIATILLEPSLAQSNHIGTTSGYGAIAKLVEQLGCDKPLATERDATLADGSGDGGVGPWFGGKAYGEVWLNKGNATEWKSDGSRGEGRNGLYHCDDDGWQCGAALLPLRTRLLA